MAALDFREIPNAQAGALRDTFELFAREFLIFKGFEIIEGPDRGADGGRDLIVKETRIGPGGTTSLLWLVSCKHKAHSGLSVTPTDEPDISDRLRAHNCDGLIAFYSTLPSSGLAKRLSGENRIRYDPESIERELLESSKGRTLAARFLPLSFQRWIQSSQLTNVSPKPDPQRSSNKFFLRNPHGDLKAGLQEATVRNLLVFVVIFNPEHPLLSRLEYSLGYFMEYLTTKKLVDQHFVPVVGPSNAEDLAALVPDDDPLENCLWVALTPEGKIVRREGVYANPDEGLKRVRSVIATQSCQMEKL